MENIVEFFDIQTSENLDTAPVRHVAQTVIVVVVEIGVFLSTDSETLLFVAAPVLDMLLLLSST